VRLLHRRTRPRAKTFRPAERYLVPAAAEARRRGHRYIGTEHILATLVQDPTSRAAQILTELGATPNAIDQALRCWLESGTPLIDPDALAALGIDLDTVRSELDRAFGPGALERTRVGCLGICPRAKMALAYAVDHAAGQTVIDDYILLGMLSVPDCVAARVLGALGITHDKAESHLADAPDNG
jgi:ATP-dependent Clp protease ATP-binding subunit ClpA